MAYLLLVLVLFCALVAAHVLFCRRTHRPGLQAKAFVQMAFGFWGLYALAAIAISHHLNPYSLWGLPFVWAGEIIFILLAPVYLCFYVLTQLMSPSKKILLAIAQKGELSYDGIVEAVRKEDFIMTRLQDLLVSGCVEEKEGRYVLTSEGRKIEMTLNLMQLCLGRKVGG